MWASLILRRLPTHRRRGIQRMESMKLYVGNLPSSTSVKDLEDLFTPYGDVTFVSSIDDTPWRSSARIWLCGDS
jgi:hypothetical protein